MIYRIVATILLVAALGALALTSMGPVNDSDSAPVSVQASPDDAAMKSLRID